MHFHFILTDLVHNLCLFSLPLICRMNCSLLWMTSSLSFQFLLWTFWISNILKINNLSFVTVLEGKENVNLFKSAEIIQVNFFLMILWFLLLDVIFFRHDEAAESQ